MRPANPYLKLDEKEQEFLTRYVLGENPFRLAAEIWTQQEAPQGPIIKAVSLMNSDKFIAALDFVTIPVMNPHALAMRQLRIADQSEDDRVKIEAIRSAAQIGGIMKPAQQRSPQEKLARRVKTQKNRLPVMPETELQAKLQALAEKAGLDGHKRETPN